jgi:hypothetical protein
MAKKPTSKSPAKMSEKSKKPEPAKATKPKATATAIRNTAVPKTSKPKAAPTPPTFDQIAKRAYELYANGVPGSESDHWFAAEQELRSGL